MGSYMKHISNAFLAQVIVYQDIQEGKTCDKRDNLVVSPRQSESVTFYKRRLEKPESKHFFPHFYLPAGTERGLYGR